jgi:hypothetical protein
LPRLLEQIEDRVEGSDKLTRQLPLQPAFTLDHLLAAPRPRDTRRAMSRENVEVMRRAYEAFNRGDLRAAVADFAPDFEYVTSGVITDAGSVYRGA